MRYQQYSASVNFLPRFLFFWDIPMNLAKTIPACVVLCLLGCETHRPIGPSNLTQAFVNENITAGQTTSHDLRKFFGNPSSVTTGANLNDENWGYNRTDLYSNGITWEGNSSSILIVTLTNGVVASKIFTQSHVGDTPLTNPNVKAK
jgi:hypothetical protein